MESTQREPPTEIRHELKANYQIGFNWPGPGRKWPVHESVAIAAFIRSSLPFPEDTTYDNLTMDQWEYIRGVVWNDDPSCLLFLSSKDTNHRFGLGASFLKEFLLGDPNRMTKRSHFGDLQFLHAMGSYVGQSPFKVREYLLNWMGVMYKLACGDQGVSETDQLSQHLPDWFDSSSDPVDSATLRDLLLAGQTEFEDTKMSYRALGSCLHMIQDSYAIGHVQRRLLNPQEYLGKDDRGYLQFNPDVGARWGAIVRFHTYGGQNETRHNFYDGLEDHGLPDPLDLNSFNSLHGTRDAIDSSINLINAVATKRPWKLVREELEQTVMALDPEPKDCDTGVDDELVSDPAMSASQAVGQRGKSDGWQESQISDLELGFYPRSVPRRARMVAIYRKHLNELILLFGFLIFLRLIFFLF